ncbi:MAG: hypothetical protein EON49_04190 [Acidovorax sp.]|nr:MAG: hypothetical protein EON49_04190 [Acidovorax sp.]
MKSTAPSIRAASWVAAQCLRRFCEDRNITHLELENFVKHLEDAAISTSIVDWYSLGSKLQVNGLGDPLPSPLDGIPQLVEVIEEAREIAASQMYSAWDPEEVLAHLAALAVHTGFKPLYLVRTALRLQVADETGWGSAISKRVRDDWTIGA